MPRKKFDLTATRPSVKLTPEQRAEVEKGWRYRTSILRVVSIEVAHLDLVEDHTVAAVLSQIVTDSFEVDAAPDGRFWARLEPGSFWVRSRIPEKNLPRHLRTLLKLGFIERTKTHVALTGAFFKAYDKVLAKLPVPPWGGA